MRITRKYVEDKLIEVAKLLKRPLIYTDDNGNCNLGYLYLTGTFQGRLSLMEVCSFSGAAGMVNHGTLKEVVSYLGGIEDYTRLSNKTFPLPEAR
jgi:hypothetical protein